jgi:Domain of unknown function (DUF4129)
VAELPNPSVPASEVGDRIDEILSRPEFQRPGPGLLERIQSWVGDRIGDIFDAIGGSGFGSLLTLALLAAAVIAVLALVRRLVRGPATRRPERVRPSTTPSSAIEQTVSSNQWRTDAERLAAEGRYAEAIRCRYRALVADLGARSLLTEIPGRTTGEERHELADTAPPAASDFDEATGLFDEIWYGDYVPGDPDDQRFRQLESEILSSAPTSRRPSEPA